MKRFVAFMLLVAAVAVMSQGCPRRVPIERLQLDASSTPVAK